MPGEAFYWILNMSVTASLAGAVLLALRKIKKLPRRLIFLLWAIPFLRMWMPVSIGSRYGLMGFLARAGVRTVTVYERAEPLTMMNCVGAAERKRKRTRWRWWNVLRTDLFLRPHSGERIFIKESAVFYPTKKSLFSRRYVLLP